MNHEQKNSFSGQLGFVLAAAGSAVGVGNIWRFPYLAAKDGGGLFLLVYLVLVFTFGFTLLTSDISIGRKTQKNSLHAYGAMKPGWNFLGVITFLVPVLIMTYYAVIGGWISRYAVAYLTGQGTAAASDTFFTDFITNPGMSALYASAFMLVTALVVFNGVKEGIETCSRFMMPCLLLSVIFIAGYALTLKHTLPDGSIRTGLQGFLVYIRPDFTGLTLKRFLQILLDAMSQIFFSLSVSMGIMITYGSYVKKDVNLNRSVSQIELVDTSVALLSGMMIVPAVFVFSGMEGMSSGPSLMFVSLPKVFHAMGGFGRLFGCLFFVMAIFAALTSCISVLETIVANCMELFRISRKRATICLTLLYTVLSVIIALGYSVFYVEVPLPNGSVGQLLDIMDYISNSLMMPFISVLSSFLIGWILSPAWIIDEMESSGHTMGRKRLYAFMIRYAAPVIMCILFLQSTGLFDF